MERIDKAGIIKIANLCHGTESVHNFWGDILIEFSNYTFEERKNAFITLIRCLLQNRIIQLMAPYDKKKREEVPFNGSNEDAVKDLNNWLNTKDQIKLDKEYSVLFLIEIEHPFMQWLKPYPITEKDIAKECLE